MTPTPEDIALYEELCHVYQKSQALELIVAHVAPLRELAEIGRLAVEEKRQAIRDPLKWSDLEAAMDALNAASGAYLRKQQSKP